MIDLLSKKSTDHPIAFFMLLGVAGSLLLSLLVCWQGSAINNDGVLYLLTAQAWLDGGWEAARTAYAWPFYSIAIAEISRFGLSLEQAAWLLNGVSMAVLVAGFVRAVARLNAERITLGFAVLLILTLPDLHDLRSETVRDIPFLALFIWHIERSFVAVERASWRAAMVGALLLGFALLFRLEAAVLALVLPLYLLFTHGPQRWLTRRNLVLIAIVAGAGYFVFTKMASGTRLADFLIYIDLMANFGASFTDRADRLAKTVLNPITDNFANEAFLAVLLAIFIGKLVKSATWLHLLTMYVQRRTIVQPGLQQYLGFSRWLAIVAIVPPLAVLFISDILTNRYLLPAVLVFLLWCPLAYRDLFSRFPRVNSILLLMFVALLAGHTLSKAFARDSAARDAGQWLSEQQGSLWCNQRALCFYSGHRDVIRLRNSPWREWQARVVAASETNDWVAVLLPHKEWSLQTQLVQQLGREPARVFSSKSGDRVLVFARQTQAASGAATP